MYHITLPEPGCHVLQMLKKKKQKKKHYTLQYYKFENAVLLKDIFVT